MCNSIGAIQPGYGNTAPMQWEIDPGLAAEKNINIVDVTQKVLQDLFTMIMIVEIPDDLGDFSEIITEIENAGKQQRSQR